MQSFDLFSEKLMRDSRMDSRAALSKEADHLERSEKKEGAKGMVQLDRQTLTSHDKAGLTCAGLIAGSPLMLLGLTFAVCDQMDFLRHNDRLKILQEQEMRALALHNALALRQACEKSKIARVPDIKDANGLMPFDVTDPEAALKKKRKPSLERARMILAGTERSTLRSVFYTEKNSREAKKLLKLKEFVQKQIELMSRRQDYHAVCKLSSQLELLDKALKRLG